MPCMLVRQHAGRPTQYIIGNERTEEDSTEAIMGALTLYLDFINLFLYLLRIFGRKK